jgi:hypothetical protein
MSRISKTRRRHGSGVCHLATEARGQSVTRETARTRRASSPPAPSGDGAEQGHAGHRGEVDEVAAGGEVGSAGHAPTTTPTQVRPARRSARRVSSVWLSVPRPGRATTEHGRGELRGDVGQGAAVVVEPDEQAARALDEHEVVVVGELRAAAGGLSGADRRRAGTRRAAVAGASGSG